MPSRSIHSPAKYAGETRPPSAAEREELHLLRESFKQLSGIQDHYARQWDEIGLEDRRMLMAIAGVDDSEESASRRWHQLLERHREDILIEGKHVLRVLRLLMSAH